MWVCPVRCCASLRTSSGVDTESNSLMSLAFLDYGGLDREVSAVDGDAGTGDVRGGFGAQKQHCASAILRRAGPAEGGVESDFDVHDFWHAHRRVGRTGIDEAGCDGVDADVVVRPPASQ